MPLGWLAGLFLMAITPVIIVAVAGFAVARLAVRAACQGGQEYPTAQVLASTHRGLSEQWPAAPIIEAPPI